MVFGVIIPYDNPNLHDQKELSDVNDDFFQKVFDSSFLLIHRIFQTICFFVFFGPIKLFASVIVCILWWITMRVLNLFSKLFRTQLQFKLFAHSIMRHFCRFLLFTLGIVNIQIDGKIDKHSRIVLSNHLSVFDFLVQFCVSPVTIVKKSDAPGIESRIFGPIFDVFYLKQKKKVSPSDQLSNLASDPSYLPILLYPEDIATNGSAIMKFRTAAFFCQYQVQATSIQYKLCLTPKGFNSMYCKNVFSFQYLLQILSVPFIQCKLKYHPVLTDKNEDEEKDPIMEATKCQLTIANELGSLAIIKHINKKRLY